MLAAEDVDGLNVAVNEARLLGIEVDLARKRAIVELSVLTLPESGPAPQDPVRVLHLSPVGRVVIGFSANGVIQRVASEELSDLVHSFGGQPIYGWEFFGSGTSDLDPVQRVSRDLRLGEVGLSWKVQLFQESTAGRHLEVCLWFDELHVTDASGSEIGLTDFIAGGKRWWDGAFAGDPRTRDGGIEPLKE
jgi:hypothetical protein